MLDRPRIKTALGRRLVCSMGVALALAAAGASAAEKFPNRAIELMVPYTAGGSGDMVARLVARHMEGELGVPVVVQNRAGAAGQIGWTWLARAKPDGYSFGLVTASLAHLPALNDNLPFDVVKDFTYITRAVEMPFVMTSSAKFGSRSAAEVIDQARKRPGELAYGSFGVGSSPHILGAMLSKEAGLKLNHVPFKGASEMVQLQITGEIPIAFDLVVTQLPHIRSAQLKPLFVTAPKRVATLPDTPTAAEVGLPTLEFATWFGFAAPRGTPPEAVDVLNKAIASALRNPEIVAKLRQGGMEPMSESPESFRRFAVDYKERIRKVLAE